MIPLILILLLVGVVALERRAFGRTGAPAPHLQRAAWPPPDAADPQRFALIVNGGWRPRKNHSRYWNTIALVHRTLRTSGWGTIAVLSAAGISTTPDRVQRSILGTFAIGPLAASPPDLDGDGRPDIDGPATPTALRDALQSIGRRMAAGDGLLVFLTDHGQFRLIRGQARAVAMLWGTEITGAAFDAMIRETIPAEAWVALVATQCHSVWFLREIHRPNTLLMASGRPLWVWSTQHYSVFAYRFCEALLGQDPVTGEPLARGGGSRATRPTLREAFDLARARDHAPEWPVSWIAGDASRAPGYF
jgi:hypothetical protein